MQKLALYLILSIIFTHQVNSQPLITEKFDNVPLIEVLKTLENKYNLKFAYDNALVQNIQVTASFNATPINEVFNIILNANGLETVMIDKAWIIRKSSKKYQSIPKNTRKPITTIHDKKTGELLPYAKVKINVNNRTTMANSDGVVVLPSIKDDSVRLKVDYIGFKSIDVKVAKLDLITNHYTLELDPIDEQNKDTSQNVTLSTIFEIGDHIGEIIVNTRNIKSLPQLASQDIMAPLALIPGVDATFETLNNLDVRHSSSDKSLITYDGFNIYNTNHLFGAISALNGKAIKDVRIFRGNFDATQGNKSSAIVELTGKTGNEKNFSASGGIDGLSADIAMEGPIGKKTTFLLTARHSLTEYYQSPLYYQILKNILSDDIPFKNSINTLSSDTMPSRVSFYDANFKLSYRPNNFDLISLSGYISNDNLDFHFVGNKKNEHIIENSTWGNKGTGLRWSHQWNHIFSHHLSLGYSSYNMDYDYNDTLIRRRIFRQKDTVLRNISSSNSLNDLNFNFSLNIKPNEYHTIETGSNISIIGIEASDHRLHTNNRTSIIDTSHNKSFNGITTAFWLQYSLSIKHLKALTLGARATYYNLTQKFYFEPRLQLYIDLSSKVVFKASTGIYRQFISKVMQVGTSYRNLWIATDGKDFPVINTLQSMVGITWHPGNAFYFDMEAYQKSTSGLSFLLNTVRLNQNNQIQQNSTIYIINSEAYGLDFITGKKWQWLETWLSYSIGHSYNQSDKINQGITYPSLDDHLNELKIGAVFTSKHLSAALTWIYGSPRPWDELIFTSSVQLSPEYRKNSSLLPAYHRLDASINSSWTIKNLKLDCGVKAFNLYNRNNLLTKNFTLTDTPVLDYLQGKSFITYRENTGMDFAFNIYLNIWL
jgi:hypothetical protein